MVDSIVDSAQWVVAGAIAIAVHLVGIMWLSSTAPAQQARSPRSGEGMVVSLGTNARTTVKAAKEPATQAAVAAAVSELKAQEPTSVASAEGALPSEPAATDQAPKPIDLRTANTAQPVKAETAKASSPSESEAVGPQPVEASRPAESKAVRPRAVEASSRSTESEAVTPRRVKAQLAEAVSPQLKAAPPRVEASSPSETEAVGPRPVEASRPAESKAVRPRAVEASSPPESKAVRPRAVEASSRSAESEAVGPQTVKAQLAEAVSPQSKVAPPRTESDSEPLVSKAVQASQATGTRPAQAPVLESEEAVASRLETHVQASVAVPASSSPETPSTVQATGKPVAEEASASESAAIEVKSIQRAPAGLSIVESIAALQPGKIRPAVPLQPVVAKPAATPVEEPAGVEVATAREPAPKVESGTEAEVTKVAKPQTVDLEHLQQSVGDNGVVAHYAGVLKGWLQKNMHYPRAARLAGEEGKVVVRFVIDRNGKVQSIKLESSSGFPLLDQEAKEMVERGNPFPAMPEEMPGERLEIRVPVSFHVRTAVKVIPPINLK